MSLAVTPRLRGLIETQSKRIATCWLLTRTDSVVLAFTTAPKILTIGGVTYTPIGSPAPSARRREGSLKAADVDIRGAISSAAITDADLYAGRYADCQVDELVADWRFAWAGAIISRRWWIGRVSFDGEAWSASLEGWPRWLLPKVGDIYTRNCRANLGDAQCGVNLAGFTVSGAVVDGTTDGEQRRVIRATTAASMSGFADGYFTNGEITFTSGANNGLRGDVKAWTQATREVELQLPMPFAIASGDTFRIVAGCDKVPTTCKSTFSNLVNFRGEPFIPGLDAVLRIRPA